MASTDVGSSYQVQSNALTAAAGDVDTLRAALGQAVQAFEGGALDVSGAFAGQAGPEAGYRQVVQQALGSLRQVCDTFAAAADGLQANAGNYSLCETDVSSSFTTGGQ